MKNCSIFVPCFMPFSIFSFANFFTKTFYMKTFTYLICFILTLGASSASHEAWAIQPIHPEKMDEVVSAHSKKEARFAKRMDRAQKRIARIVARVEHKIARKGMESSAAGIDLQDPVKKWMWFWILGWGAAIVFYVLATVLIVGTVGSGFGIAALLSLIGSLCGIFGTVSLIMWIVKMNS